MMYARRITAKTSDSATLTMSGTPNRSSLATCWIMLIETEVQTRISKKVLLMNFRDEFQTAAVAKFFLSHLQGHFNLHILKASAARIKMT